MLLTRRLLSESEELLDLLRPSAAILIVVVTTIITTLFTVTLHVLLYCMFSLSLKPD